MPKEYDVIVIGGGIGGLTAAALLSHQHFKVLVLEAHDKPGGCASSWVRKARDAKGIARRFVFDSGVQDISGFGPNSSLRQLLSIIGATEHIRWRRVHHRYIQDDDVIDVPEGWAAWQSHLMDLFPKDRSGIERLFQTINQIQNEINQNLRHLFSVNSQSVSLTDWVSANPLTMRWMKEKYAVFLDEHISDPQLKKTLTIVSEYVTNDPQLLTVGDMVPLFEYYRHGGYYPAGGTQKLANTLRHVIERSGGTVMLKCMATKIQLEGAKVKSVATAGGRLFYGRSIIANIDMAACFDDLLSERPLPSRYASRLNSREPGPSAILINLGLDFVPDIPARTFLHQDDTRLGIGNLSRIDASLAPEGHASLTLLHLLSSEEGMRWLSMSRQEYGIEKQAVADTIIDAAATIIPGLRKHIIHYEVATPATIRHYIRTRDGSIYGSAIGQRSPGTRSPIDGLVFAGSNCANGPGVEAVVVSGFEAAQQITLFLS